MGFKARPARALGLSDEWREWIAQAMADGVSGQVIVDALVERGTPRELALREIDVIASATRGLRRRASRFDMQLRLQAELDREGLDRYPSLDSDDFYRHYYGQNRPVLLTEQIRDWKPVGTWTPRWLADNFGDLIVQVNDGRLRDPQRAIDPEAHLTPIKLAELVDDVEREQGNDFYLVSRNRALEGPLAELLESLDDMPSFLEGNLQGRASLWLGPAGTLTPLHHDTTNVFFCQIYGTKRITLVSPRHRPVLGGELRSTFYSDALVEPGSHRHVVDIEAGQALFLPVGWFHQVEALTPSISLSLTNFKRPNRFDWYRPGDC